MEAEHSDPAIRRDLTEDVIDARHKAFGARFADFELGREIPF